jgi:hypothetical protein
MLPRIIDENRQLKKLEDSVKLPQGLAESRRASNNSGDDSSKDLKNLMIHSKWFKHFFEGLLQTSKQLSMNFLDYIRFYLPMK